MSEPTTDQVRLDYMYAYPSTPDGREIAGAEFDRWLADVTGKAYRAGFESAAALAEQGETEWEFSWSGTDDEGDDWVMDDTFDSRESAEAYTRRPIGGWVHTDHGELVRRRKAGPWMPVEQGEDREVGSTDPKETP